MLPLPPSFSVNVRTEKRACVLDTHLALSRYGLLLAQRLCNEFDLWLVRELWNILDNTQYYLSHPELLRPAASHRERSSSAGNENSLLVEDERAVVLHDILSQWEMARNEADLAGLKIFWISDSMSDSLLPAGTDQNIVYRFETLAGSLELRSKVEEPAESAESIFMDCFRDAAALTAALMPYRGFILARQGTKTEDSPDNEPLICSYLRAWGIRCYRVGAENKTRIEREFMSPILARTGISELIWAGLSLAAVHIVAPEAVIMPRCEEAPFSESLTECQAKREINRKDWWKGAVCFWYPL